VFFFFTISRHTRSKVLALLSLVLLSAQSAHALTEPADTVKKTVSPYVGNIRFSGNKSISEDELRQIIATTEHTSFLGLGLFGGAKKPLNSEEFNKDISLIKKLYTYKGFFFSDINSAVDKKGNGRKVNINIRIRENEPTRVDSLNYIGLEPISGDLRRLYLSRKLLKVNDIFSVERLIEERNRTISFFREYGYAFFHEDSIRIKIDTVGTHAGVRFRLNLPQRIKYGGVNVVVNSTARNAAKANVNAWSKDGINTRVIGKQKISPNLIVSAIEFRPGDLARQSLEQNTLRNFGLTNIFSSIYINPDSVRAGELFTTIHLETAPKHQIEPKLLVDNRYGELFFGGALAFENKNLFGGAEKFLSTATYGTQSGSSSRVLANLAEGEYEKVTPREFSLKNRLLLPVLKKPGNFYSVTAEYATTTQPILLSSRNALVRSSYNARLGPSSRLNFDFFEFELVQKDSLRGFKKLFKTDLATNIGIDPTNENRVNAGIDSLLNTHVNQSFRLRYNYSNRLNTLPEKTIWNLDLLVEESGSLAWLVDNYFDKKSYSGFSERDPQIFGIAYSQYVKLESGMGFTKNLSPRSQLAGIWSVGLMRPYGKAETTPEERRFYAGGPNSMRGWLFNTLGPGRSASEAASNFGADIKLELGLEYRRKFFKVFKQPSGITFFTDIGNIWDRTGPYALTLGSLRRDFAWDAGAGLRVGSPIGPFRFDFAWKLHDPSEIRPWKISRLRLQDYTFSFGIGEAF